MLNKPTNSQPQDPPLSPPERMIDYATIQRVKDAADIVDVVKEFVTLRKAGANYKGLCPFHNEKTPSFVVTPSKQICKCFGCGKGGDAVHFVMEMEQLTYPEAIKWLGRKYGIEVKEREETDEERQASSLRQSMLAVNEWACGYFENILHTHPDGKAVGMAYLRSRGLRDDIIKRFRLGFSLEQRDALSKAAKAKGYQEDFLTKTGLCFKTDEGRLIDKYRSRVIFPIFSVSGSVVGFGGRILTNDKKMAKYINSPDSEIYDKSRELYGLYQSKKAIVKEDRCYMVEGYMDVISMHQSGVENVVASSGTSLTEGQIRLLHRFTKNITVLYDGDAAGIHASLRGIDMLLSEGMNVKVLLLPDGDDPDSFAKKHSAEEFKKYLEERQTDFITFKTDLLMKDAAGDPIRRAGLIADIVRSISVIPEGIVRQTYAHECARMLDTDEALILSEVSKERKNRLQRDIEKKEKEENRQDAEPESQTPTPTAELQLATQQRQDELPEERALIQQVVRHGEYTFEVESEDEDTPGTICLAEYVAQELSKDDMHFSNALYQEILDKAIEIGTSGAGGTLQYFLSHPDPRISGLAGEIGVDKEELSRNNKTMYGSEEEHLDETITTIINEMKYSFIKRRLKRLEHEVHQLSQEGKMEACMEKMREYKENMELLSTLSFYAGERVVTGR